jgi:hypothetical protein
MLREGWQVLDFLIAKHQEAKRDPDLRLLKRAYRYYLHGVSSNKLLHGQDLIETALRKDTDPSPDDGEASKGPAGGGSDDSSGPRHEIGLVPGAALAGVGRLHGSNGLEFLLPAMASGAG